MCHSETVRSKFLFLAWTEIFGLDQSATIKYVGTVIRKKSLINHGACFVEMTGEREQTKMAVFCRLANFQQDIS